MRFYWNGLVFVRLFGYDVGGKSQKRENFGLYSGRDFSIRDQPIQKSFTVLETVIQGVHCLLCNPLDIFAP